MPAEVWTGPVKPLDAADLPVSLALQTLGCKLNQLESEAVAGAFKSEGFRVVPWGEPADILILNTCTVTSKAEQKARRTIRKALRDNPAACLIVTGCYAQLGGASIAALDAEDRGNAGACMLPRRKRLFVVSGDMKSRLLDLPRRIAGEPGSGDISGIIAAWADRAASGALPRREKAAGAFRFNPAVFSFHSRSSLKIQDGCDHRCTYCRVPLARGKSVSLDAETVLSRLRKLEEGGYGEAVLTGVNINQYRSSALDLWGLLDLLLRGTSRIALRLSSIEPEELDSGSLSILAHPRIRPHFHLSVQSGSGKVLASMGRRYGPEDIERGAARLRALKADPFLACDIIAGFPGETSGEFEKTYDLCRRIGFAWIHPFPYSPRPGTAAVSFDGKVSQREAAARVEALLSLARRGKADYTRRWQGKTVEAIAESFTGGKKRCIAAVADNYLRLMIPRSPEESGVSPGQLLRCRLCGAPGLAGEAGSFDALAQLVETPCAALPKHSL
jgi:threonylcarbamoyladenosine tRNA methylthiotransferase MtaB